MNGSVIDFFSSSAEEFASAYDKDPDFRMRFDLWTQILGRYAKGLNSALDLGCGSGVFSFYLARLGLEVTGVDAAEGMIKLCEQHRKKNCIKNSRFYRKVIPFDPQELESVDLVISSSVLEYVENLGDVFRFVHAILRPNGIFVLSLPNARSLYRKFERLRFRVTGRPAYYRFVKNVVSASQITLALKSHGFHMEEIAYYGHSNSISKFGRACLPPEYTENLFLGVFRRQ